jgi:hypothetical protein
VWWKREGGLLALFGRILAFSEECTRHTSTYRCYYVTCETRSQISNCSELAHYNNKLEYKLELLIKLSRQAEFVMS